MNKPGIKPLYAALAVAAVGLLVMPIAFAGAAANPSKMRAHSTVARLERQISRLQSRVGTLERKGSGPAGPAGGALQGSYPNPGLRSGAVTAGNIAPGTVGALALGENSVTNGKLADNAVSTRNIAPGAVGATQLGPASVDRNSLASGTVDGEKLALGAVSGAALAGAFPVQGSSVNVDPGKTEEATVTCPDGSRLLSGGGEWSPNNRDDTVIIGSSPSFTGDASHTWVVQARVASGARVSAIFFPEALCLNA